jgi:hypothetical protein
MGHSLLAGSRATSRTCPAENRRGFFIPRNLVTEIQPNRDGRLLRRRHGARMRGRLSSGEVGGWSRHPGPSQEGAARARRWLNHARAQKTYVQLSICASRAGPGSIRADLRHRPACGTHAPSRLDVKAGAAKLKADRVARLEAELVVDRWNRRLATPGHAVLLRPSGPHWSPERLGSTIFWAIDLRTVDRHPTPAVGTLGAWSAVLLVPPATAPMPKLLGLYVLPPANRTREGTA